jgi:hypothetical protein
MSISLEINATIDKTGLSQALGMGQKWIGRVNGVGYGTGDTESEAIAAAVRILNEGIEREGVQSTLERIREAQTEDAKWGAKGE